MDGAFVQITDRTGAWTVDGITVLEPHPKNYLEVHRTVRVDELGIKVEMVLFTSHCILNYVLTQDSALLENHYILLEFGVYHDGTTIWSILPVLVIHHKVRILQESTLHTVLLQTTNLLHPDIIYEESSVRVGRTKSQLIMVTQVRLQNCILKGPIVTHCMNGFDGHPLICFLY